MEWKFSDLTVSANDDVLVSVYNDSAKDINVEVIRRNGLGNYIHSALVNFIPVISSDDDDSDGLSDDHLISCIDKKRIVICRGKKLIIYNHSDNSEEDSITLDGIPSCLTVRGSDILAVYSSPSCLQLDVQVFESNLKKKCGIKLSDVPPSEKIKDVAVISGKVIVCTSKEVFLWNEEEDKKILEYSLPTEDSSPISIDVNEDYQMVAILWSSDDYEEGKKISFYSINCRFCLFIAGTEEEACKVRFINSDNIALVINDEGKVSEVSLHHINYFLSWNNFFNAYIETILNLSDGCCHSHLQTVFNISEGEKQTAMSSMESESSQFGPDRIQWKLKQLKCIFNVLRNRTSSTSEQIALLIEAANELGKYHAYTLWSSIKFYQLCSSGSSCSGDIPYSSYERQESAESLEQSLSSSHPGTSRSEEQYPAAAPQSGNSSVLLVAQTIPSGPETQKRSATSESGSVEGSVSKRKYTLQEHSPTAVARTMVQMASMSHHQPQLLPGRSNLDFTLSQLFHNNKTPNALLGTFPQSDTAGMEQSLQPLQVLPTVFPVSQNQRVNTNMSTSLHPQLTTPSNQGNITHTAPSTRGRSEHLPSNRMTTSHLRGTSREAMLHKPSYAEVSSANECIPQQSSLYHLSSNTGVQQQTSATISVSSPSLHPAPMNEIDGGQLVNTAQAPQLQGGSYLQLLSHNDPVTTDRLLFRSPDQLLPTNPPQPNVQATSIHQSFGLLNSQSRQIIPLQSLYQTEGQLQVQQSETLVAQPDMQSGIRQLDTTTTPEMTPGESLDVHPNLRRSGMEQTDAVTVTEISQGNTPETNLESETEPNVGRNIPERDQSSDLYVQTEQILAVSQNRPKEQGISTPHTNSLTVRGSTEQSTMASTSSAGDVEMQEVARSHHKLLTKTATTDTTQESLHKIASVLNEPFLAFLQNFLHGFRSDQRPAHEVQMSACASTSGTHHIQPQQSCLATREQDLLSAASDQFKEYWSSLDAPLKQKLLDYKDKTDDREALVRLLLENLFSEEERRSQNCNGKAGLGRLDQNRLMKIRSITFELCPLRTNRNSGDVEAKEWTRLCNVIDAANRHFREKLKRQSKR